MADPQDGLTRTTPNKEMKNMSRNKMSKKQYDEVKNKTVGVVMFRKGVRVSTTTGLSYYQLVQEMEEMSQYNAASFYILPEGSPIKLGLIKNEADFVEAVNEYRKNRREVDAEREMN